MSEPSTPPGMPKVPLTKAEEEDRTGLGEEETLHGGPRAERRALAWLALGAILLIMWITKPVGLGVLLGALTAFCLEPIYKRLVVRSKRPRVVAIGLVIATGVLIMASLAGVVWIFVNKGVNFGQNAVTSLSDGGSATKIVDAVATRLEPLGVKREMIVERLRHSIANVTQHASDAAGAVASITTEMARITGEVLMAVFFLLLTAHLILRRWNAILSRAQAAFPLRPDYTLALFEEFRKVGRATLQGTLVTGIAQGVLAGIGFAIAGFADWAFFGAATAVASLIPAIGTLIVWVPAGIFLFVTDHVGAGIFTFAWGMVMVVGLSDYIIRPRLVGGDEKTPELFTFAALLGGVEVIGLEGLIVGPILMSLSLAVIRIYEREAIATRKKIIRRDALEDAQAAEETPPPSEIVGI